MVSAQNLKIAKPVSHAQLVISLELVPVAGPADALKVFSAVWIPCPQSSDQNRTKFGAGSGEREASDTRSARA